jgi:hypothetical protein
LYCSEEPNNEYSELISAVVEWSLWMISRVNLEDMWCFLLCVRKKRVLCVNSTG